MLLFLHKDSWIRNAVRVMLLASVASTAAFSIGLPYYRPSVLVRNALGSCLRNARHEKTIPKIWAMGLDGGSYGSREQPKPNKGDLIQDFLTQRSVQVIQVEILFMLKI